MEGLGWCLFSLDGSDYDILLYFVEGRINFVYELGEEFLDFYCLEWMGK